METEELSAGVVSVIEIIGVVVVVVGFGIAAVLAVRALSRGKGGKAAYQTLRTSIGGSILLGLEIFVAADIIHTLSAPSLEVAAVLGLIVVIRTILSMSIQIEIDGVLPWRRALLTSGGQVLAGAITEDTRSAQ
ncbi:DUF1622 domain-containing protein [Leucobacter coleopterorum]|uniref:DUF1622 domain-containing protein n=1 Tax=Leucobacter coleopterorum TaxID=2714933 RepID=A0ABX6K1D9_9MICO|nr:DUF1622 domain-containing protein [Leucobacter coleopterorum]QIM18914.1 DUF1622 domain-containing protein [Leucobacter coleopterorum]